MKKLLSIILCCVIICSLVGCGAEKPAVVVNVDNKDSLSGIVFGKDAMIEIGNGIWYDSTTRITYWWVGTMTPGYYSSTTPSPYYAPNGLPYLYNPETNTFEEIE